QYVLEILPCLNKRPSDAVALRCRPRTRQPDVSLSSRWASTGGRGRPNSSAAKEASRLGPPLGPRWAGGTAGFSLTSIHLLRGSTRARISSAVSSAISVKVQVFRLRSETANTHSNMNDTTETPKLSWWRRLSGGLKRTSSSLGSAVADLVIKRKLDRAMLEDI